MKKAFIILIFLISPFYAYGENKAALVETLFDLIHMQEIFDQTWKQYLPLLESRLKAIGDDKLKGNEDIENLKRQLLEAFANEFSWENSKSDYIKIYSDVYDKEDLKELIEFYSSPLGKKATEKDIYIKKAILTLVIEKRNEYNSKIDILIEDFILASLLKSAKNHRVTGDLYYSKKDYKMAIDEYYKAIDNNPDDAISINNLAWLLATCPERKFRDGKKAIELAKKAIKISPDLNYFDTLASAYSETGDFNNAIKVMEEVLEKAKRTKIDQKMLSYYQDHLEKLRKNM